MAANLSAGEKIELLMGMVEAYLTAMDSLNRICNTALHELHEHDSRKAEDLSLQFAETIGRFAEEMPVSGWREVH